MPLDRDVIFLAEVGRGGQHRASASSSWSTSTIPTIDAEYCLAEGGGVTRIGGAVKYARIADAREDPARDRADRARHRRATARCRCGPTPSSTSPARSRKIGEWRPDIRLNETTGTYFRRLAAISPPERGRRAIATCCRPIRKSPGRRRRLAVRQRAGALVDAAHLGRRRTSSPAATA